MPESAATQAKDQGGWSFSSGGFHGRSYLWIFPTEQDILEWADAEYKVLESIFDE